MKKAIYFIAFLFFSTPVIAQNLVMHIDVTSPTRIVGLPIEVEAVIQAERPFTLHGAFGIYCNIHGGVTVTDKSGRRVSSSSGVPCVSVTESPFDSQYKVKYVKSAEAKTIIFLPAGSYQLQAYYYSKGPYLDRYSEQDQRLVEGIWEGNVQSNVVTVEIRLPEGEDRNALLNLGPGFNGSAEDYATFMKSHRKELLKEYFDSTYTAEWILDQVAYPDTEEPSKMKYLVDSGYYPMGNVVPDPDSPSGYSPTLPTNRRARWYIENLPRIIEKHPDLKRIESARLAVALSHLALGNHEEAAKELTEVARHTTKQAEWARAFILQAGIRP